jgi:hypothetical protein
VLGVLMYWIVKSDRRNGRNDIYSMQSLSSSKKRWMEFMQKCCKFSAYESLRPESGTYRQVGDSSLSSQGH